MNVLEMKGISKGFPGVKALSNVNFQVQKGEVHGLLGANGAGKSTLMKVLSGVYQADDGEIIFKGKKTTITSPLEAQLLGISIIHQELNLVPSLSIAENIFLGRLEGKAHKVNWRQVNEKASILLKQIGADLNPKALVRDLTVAQMQLVEIAKALSFQPELIIMDEPSAVLSGPELERLFETIDTLTNRGVTVIYISHRLEEIFQICNRITIMRDGLVIETSNVEDIDRDYIIRGIVGRELSDEYPEKKNIEIGEELFSVNNLSRKGKLNNISFNVKQGEIIGLAGLVGSGRTEIARCIYGADPFDEGTMIYKGKEISVKNPQHALSHGIVLVPEDRKNHGLITRFSLRQNFTMAALRKIRNVAGFFSVSNEKRVSNELVDQLKVKTPSVEQKALNLSGGNQQKVVIGKSLFTDADVFILDEPTRGVDVGAKREIYLVIHELAKQGKAVILISSDWEELIALSDRLIVVHEGDIKGEICRAEASPDKIMQLALT